MTDHKTHTGQQDQQQGTASRTYHDVVDKASSALASTTASAKDAGARAADGLEANPLAVLVGGIAVGALAGALLPRSDKEKELLAPVGQRLGETARQAFAAAKEAGKQELDGAGLTPGAARDRGKDLLGGLTKALSSAGTAATQAMKQGQSGQTQSGSDQPGSSGIGQSGTASTQA